ncbi:succinylglutamate desuccinylase/aspartoacylase family protein [Meiothermus granaticius]|uniref:N-alpha-acetyl-L-2,4-diaminobutyric acid deacetylase n=1 Tax=Meiothermus granaticius NBRC 107808 TaxID=1227551 RepID=A0A399F930_9DEIN|nr:succinylglutamate desuccinylase/aspartoacylase family protein [Meiothermus granaticius]MCL6525266.1 succinylglutamate desuccinylase/aspartoacylase family protein [Thermaceae bacterium]RIH91769.1 N-alpha-acetyl-L-2,4-diaminobutyric acid deacetylase [Meiothermus granaticius NBRC 107808]GEM88107.1 deacylase [Meiothermus granaticius NBRC 107808]
MNPSHFPELPSNLPPGTLTQGYVSLELDVPLELPFTLVQGARPGPNLLVTAGIHGAEYASIAAAVQVAQTPPQTLAGSLTVLPIVNRPAYRTRSIYINPVDGKNLNRCFPGDPGGSFAQQLAHWLTENAIQRADAYIDLHGGDLNEGLTPFTIFIEGDEASRRLAEVFGLELLVSSSPGGTTTAAGYRCGVPSILAEAGGNGLWPEADVEALASGVRRVMQHLGMLEGPLEPKPTRLLHEFAWLRSEHEGLWYPKVGAGAQVQAGQDLGRITDPFGKVLQTVNAPLAGTVLFVVSSLAINPGDPLYGIGA